MTKTLTLLHTSPAHINTFDILLQEIAPNIPVQQIVDETLLQAAREAGEITPTLANRIQQTISDAAGSNGSVVLCTCSTIGGWAEQATETTNKVVIRVDRPMAERAIALGRRIIVAATLESTIIPTRELLLSVAQEAGKPIEIIELFCETAWSKFEAGDQQGYIHDIAQALHGRASAGDVIVLAQASMAAAAELCVDLTIPILSSPRLGLETALKAYHQQK